MIKKVISTYKVPLLLSVTLSIVLLAVGVVRNPIDIFATILGCLLGTFVLESEYILYAYIYDPDSDYSKNIRGYIDHKDYKGLIDFIETHRKDLKDKSLNSVLFQVILAPICIFAVYASTSYFIKTFVLSVFLNSIYKLIEVYFEGNLKDWFWTLKSKPNQQGFLLYTASLVGILVFCLNIF